MVDPDKERRRAEILAWLEEHPVTVTECFQGMPDGDASTDAQAVMGGIFSGIEKLWGAMTAAIHDLRPEDVAEVMFGDAEYWANHPVERPTRPPG